MISKPRSNFQVTDGSSMQPFEVRFPHQFSRFLNEEIELDVRDTRYEQDMNRSEYIDMLNFATCFVQLWSCKTLVLLHQWNLPGWHGGHGAGSGDVEDGEREFGAGHLGGSRRFFKVADGSRVAPQWGVPRWWVFFLWRKPRPMIVDSSEEWQESSRNHTLYSRLFAKR